MREAEKDPVSNLFVLLEPVSLTADAGKKASQYLKSYAKSHSVQLGDALIAACAFTTGFSLWTLNRKHYPMPELMLYPLP